MPIAPEAVRNDEEIGGDFDAAKFLTIPLIVAGGGLPGAVGASGPFPPSSQAPITEIAKTPAIHESLLIRPMPDLHAWERNIRSARVEPRKDFSMAHEENVADFVRLSTIIVLALRDVPGR
jgi:hypothetical protein